MRLEVNLDMFKSTFHQNFEDTCLLCGTTMNQSLEIYYQIKNQYLNIQYVFRSLYSSPKHGQNMPISTWLKSNE